MIFEWDTEKALENQGKHGVTFDEAERAFEDFYSIETLDDEHSTFEETRFKMIAMSGWRILVVVYTMRGESTRIISSREAENHERELYERQRSEDAFYDR
jgi:hypothetical protein